MAVAVAVQCRVRRSRGAVETGSLALEAVHSVEREKVQVDISCEVLRYVKGRFGFRFYSNT